MHILLTSPLLCSTCQAKEKRTLLLKIPKSIGHNAKASARTECAAQISLGIFHREHMHWFYWFCHLSCFRIHCLKASGNYFSAQRKGSLPHNQAIRKQPWHRSCCTVYIQTLSLPNIMMYQTSDRSHFALAFASYCVKMDKPLIQNSTPSVNRDEDRES